LHDKRLASAIGLNIRQQVLYRADEVNNALLSLSHTTGLSENLIATDKLDAYFTIGTFFQIFREKLLT
jgi:hypothetical protein